MPENRFQELSSAMAEAVERAGNSTITVNARRRIPASGIAISKELLITASHVVEREEEILIGLPNSSEIQATLVGRDPGSDLAVLKSQAQDLKPAAKIDREVRIGELVLAIGRPGAQGLQASLGVIHASGGPIRTERGAALERYLLTDATPYPGFSGGPLVDADGNVVGMNTSGFAPGSSIVVPAIIAWQVAESINLHGRVRRGYLGVRSQTVNIPETSRGKFNRSQETGLLLVGIEADSPAAKSGLMVGDILIGINDQAVKDHDALMLALGSETVGQVVKAEILRGGLPQMIDLTIGERT